MSPEAAEACGIMRLLDRRFAGVARGVGTANILGRVHSAQLKLADLHLPCSFTIMEGRDVDLLFGLDMLKAHQACIDLEKNVLRIQGREVRFLPEHELPEKARNFETPLNEDGLPVAGPSGSGSGSGSGASSGTPDTTTPTHFPGSGNTLGSAPAPARVPAGARGAAPPAMAPQTQAGAGASVYPEDAIATLIGLGATREIGMAYLDVVGGNLEVAALLLFQ